MRADLASSLNLIIVIAVGVLAVPAVGLRSEEQTFKTRTDLILVDAQVVTRAGEPIPDLVAADFRVDIGGKPGRIASVEFIDALRRTSAAVDDAAAREPGAARAQRPASDLQRRYILAVDETSFTAGAALAWKQAITRFVAQLDASDLAGLYSYPSGGPLVPLTSDRAMLLQGLVRTTGRFAWPDSRFHLSASEVIDITAGDRAVARLVAERECSRLDLIHCTNTEVPREAQAVAREVEMLIAESIGGLRSLMRSLKSLEGRKTVVLVSGGLLAGDRIGARMDVNHLIEAVAREADEANVNLYVLHLDTTFLDAFAAGGRHNTSQMRESGLMGLGLERFAGGAGGQLIRVQGGTGDEAFTRILRETSSHYLLGVEPPSGHDGRPARITVRVNRPGAEVRHRAWATTRAR